MDNYNFDSLVKSVYKNIESILSLEKVNEIARQTKFIQRDSNKINAFNFLALMAFYGKNICTESLANLCNCLANNDNISITTQALDERINARAVEFLKKIFFELLDFNIESSLDFSNEFDRIMITDSTAFQLPNELVYLLYTLRWQIELIFKV